MSRAFNLIDATRDFLNYDIPHVFYFSCIDCANGFNSYGTPIKGLFLCGSGTHPGGGVYGAPGKNCAEYIMKYD